MTKTQKGFAIPDSNVWVNCGGNCDVCNYCDDCNWDTNNPQYMEQYESMDFDDYMGNMPCDTYGEVGCPGDGCRSYAACKGLE